MTHRLILTRHAKSSWDDPTMEDHERPLNKRGRLAATDMGEWLAQHEFVPDLVLCSTSARTTETWELIATVLPNSAKTQFDRSLYLASPDELLSALKSVEKAETVMLIGHNPGISLTAAAFASNPPHHPRFEHYPTAATTVYKFDVSGWDQLAWGGGDVLDFAVPRDQS